MSSNNIQVAPFSSEPDKFDVIIRKLEDIEKRLEPFTQPPEFVTPKQAAKALGVGLSTFYNTYRAHKRGHRNGQRGKIILTVEDLEYYKKTMEGCK